MKKSIIASMKAGAQGAKISIGGRLGGAEMHAQNQILKAGCRCIHSERISITASLKLIQPTVRLALKRGFLRGDYW